MASTTIAITVVASTPMRIPARTPRATSTPVSSSPTQNTAVGQEAIEPSMPSPTGTVVFAASGRRRTNPASTNPMKAMNAPIPAAIAILSGSGMALNTAVRNPVRPRITMITPLTTTRPIASGQVTCGAIVTATRVLMPRPVAIANGKLATRPKTIVMTPATSAVTAATCGTESVMPSTSRFADGLDGIEAAEDQRVEDHDVGHRHEGDEPTAHLAGDGGPALVQAEVALQHGGQANRITPASCA